MFRKQRHEATSLEGNCKWTPGRNLGLWCFFGSHTPCTMCLPIFPGRCPVDSTSKTARPPLVGSARGCKALGWRFLRGTRGRRGKSCNHCCWSCWRRCPMGNCCKCCRRKARSCRECTACKGVPAALRQAKTRARNPLCMCYHLLSASSCPRALAEHGPKTRGSAGTAERSLRRLHSTVVRSSRAHTPHPPRQYRPRNGIRSLHRE
mmetsp:Transcript_115594/g.373529  ORF Transcript_115594/g.373529 Transcript_115594/m.373529 type:complete len:206 (-) Transcript_115594:1467-2084(-)